MSGNELYRTMIQLITPRPIAWVSTVSDSGIANLAPFSYFNAVGSKPPTLMFCPANRPDGAKKDTLTNIEQNGEFVVNVVTAEVADAMNQSAANYDTDTSEFDACGLTTIASSKIAPPRVAEAKAQFECKLHTVLNLGTGPGGANMVVGQIVAIHVDDSVLDQDGRIEPGLLQTIGRMGGLSYTKTNERFDLDRPTV